MLRGAGPRCSKLRASPARAPMLRLGSAGTNGHGGAPAGPRAWLLLRNGLIGLLAAAAAVYFVACCVVLSRGSSAGSGAPHGSAIAADAAGSLRGGSGGAGRAGTSADTGADHLTVRAELGRGAWNMLHRLAAKFPAEPTAEQSAEAVQFFRLLGNWYPCDECAGHFREMLAAHPVRAGSHAELTTWLCERHNQVNERLGKPAFPCDAESLAAKYGDCGCSDKPAGEAAAASGAGAAPAAAPHALQQQQQLAAIQLPAAAGGSIGAVAAAPAQSAVRRRQRRAVGADAAP